MVIVQNRPIKYAERLIRENPKYSIAFKEYGETVIATVSHILWEASKHRVIKPVVKVEPIMIGGFTIKSLTAFNAGWVWNNKVGPGTKLRITHNTIPHILGVEESTTAQMPPLDVYPEGSWEWNATHVDIILHEDTDETRIAKIYEFFKQMGAKYWGETTITKLYNGGYNTVRLLLEATKDDLIQDNIDGIGEGTIDRMLKTRDETLPLMTLHQMMSASCCFGMGFGQRRLKAIVDAYPNILNMEPTLEDIQKLDGFAQITAEKFIVGLPMFRLFLKENMMLQRVLNGEIKPVPVPAAATLVVTQPQAKLTGAGNGGQSVSGKAFVFTGFRDKQLESTIQNMGGEVKTGVSKKVNYLVVGGVKGQGSAKEKKATELGIPILSLDEFRGMFGL